jgi:hypothetical protein
VTEHVSVRESPTYTGDTGFTLELPGESAKIKIEIFL